MDRRDLSRTYQTKREDDAAELLACMIADESYRYVLSQVKEHHISDREIYRAIDTGSRLYGNRKTGMMSAWLDLLDMYGIAPRERK